MRMQMRHFLTANLAIINDDTESARATGLDRQLIAIASMRPSAGSSASVASCSDDR